MRRVGGRTLSSEGWEVVVVDGGKAALASVADHSEPFDCVVSDVHIHGLELTDEDLSATAARWPATPRAWSANSAST